MRFCFSMLIMLCSFWASAHEKNILVVHSYHQGFFWTDSFQLGLAQTLGERDIALRVLYLDTKRNQSASFLNQLYFLYKTKVEQERFDAIVVSDNVALQLMQRLAEPLAGTPVIFGGINNYTPEMHAGLNATGVIEDIDLLSNVSLIERLQPQAQQIFVVTDHSITGVALRAQVDKFLSRYPEYQQKVQHLVPNTLAELIERVQMLDLNSAVLFWAYYRAAGGLITAMPMVR